MDFCSHCGEKTDPDWVFCRACGAGLDMLETSMPPAISSDDEASPKVELISRGWDVVEIDAVPGPEDPLESEPTEAPLSPGAVEIAVDDIAVVEGPHHDDVETEDELEPAPAAGGAGRTGRAGSPVMGDSDRWDHLRPHGDIPPLRKPSRTAARIGQLAVLVFALGALVASIVRLYLNTRLDGYADGRVSSRLVADVELAADIALFVAGGLAVLAIAALVVWLIRRSSETRFRPGLSGFVALIATIAGGGLVGYFLASAKETVADALTANSMIIVGLGLMMTASLAIVRTVSRIEDG